MADGNLGPENQQPEEDYSAEVKLNTSDLLEKYRRTVAEPLPLLTDYSPRGQAVAFAAYQQAVIELLERLDAYEAQSQLDDQRIAKWIDRAEWAERVVEAAMEWRDAEEALAVVPTFYSTDSLHRRRLAVHGLFDALATYVKGRRA